MAHGLEVAHTPMLQEVDQVVDQVVLQTLLYAVEQEVVEALCPLEEWGHQLVVYKQEFC